MDLRNRSAAELHDLIGYDTSASAQDLSVLCADCGDVGAGAPIYAGDEWGAHIDEHCCSECERDLALDGLVLVEDPA